MGTVAALSSSSLAEIGDRYIAAEKRRLREVVRNESSQLEQSLGKAYPCNYGVGVDTFLGGVSCYQKGECLNLIKDKEQDFSCVELHGPGKSKCPPLETCLEYEKLKVHEFFVGDIFQIEVKDASVTVKFNENKFSENNSIKPIPADLLVKYLFSSVSLAQEAAEKLECYRTDFVEYNSLMKDFGG